MADVYTYTDSTGVITIDAGEINAEVIAEYQTTFGADLITTPNTPQGMLIATETLARIAVADNNAALANQINPNVAGGVFLDALLSLLGSSRTPATYSSVLCTLTGIAGTSIPAGSQAYETGSGNMNVFQLAATTVIPAGGTANNVLFTAVNSGPVPAAAGTLTAIVSSVLGWETITNPLAATLGVTTQSDASARLFRQNTLAAQGTGLAQAIMSALYLTPGVTSLTFQENISDTVQVINNVSMAPHSLYTCVAGTATSLAVATTLTNTKSGGCAYNNGPGSRVMQPVVNQYSGQSILVLYDTPAFIQVNIVATVHALTSVQNIQTAVQNAILTYANGGIPGEPGFTVGQAVSPFQLAGAINILIPGLFVQEIQISIYSLTETGTITQGLNTVTGLGNNALIPVGAGVSGVGIPAGTTVSTKVSTTGLTLSTTAFPTFMLSGSVVSGMNTITGLGSNTQILVGMGVSDGVVNIPGGTTVTGLVGTTGVTMSANATGSATESITFTPVASSSYTGLLTFTPASPALQTTEIPLDVWQQAVASTGLISVIQV